MSSNSSSNNSITEVYISEKMLLKQLAAHLARFSSKEAKFLRQLGQNRNCWAAKEVLSESGKAGNIVMFFLAYEHLPAELVHYAAEAVQSSIVYGKEIAIEYLERKAATADRGPNFLDEIRNILLAAAEAGSLPIVEKCNELGLVPSCDYYNGCLYAAAYRGDQRMVELCFRLGASDANKVLCGAAAGGRLGLMYLARRLGETQINEAATHASIHREMEALALCVEWGASNSETAGPESL